MSDERRQADGPEPARGGAVVGTGDVLHVIERRSFVGDVRRHFVGTVVAASDVAARVSGWAFVLDPANSQFLRRPERRTRVVAFADARLIVNILPSEVDPSQVRYQWDQDGNLTVTDGTRWRLDIQEFGWLSTD